MKFPPLKNYTKKTGNYSLVTSNSLGFTLIELIVSITIFASIIVIAFDAMGNIWILRTRISDRMDLNTELYNATEKFVDLIKTGGDIDYEEYWNRQTVGTATMSGHYSLFSGFGNYGNGGSTSSYGDGIYYCRSGSGTYMGTGGCVTGFNTYGNSISLTGTYQRFGQYRQQFIDYNSNANGDKWDEDSNGNVRGDDDDEDLGMGPSAFTGGVGMKELYLIKEGAKHERVYFRWIIKLDPNSPPGSSCEVSGTNMGSGECLWNIQMLKLTGKDLGFSHSWAVSSSGRYDGIVDTWECHSDFNCAPANIPHALDDGWIDIFPAWVNVRNVDFYPYPEKNFRYSWKDTTDTSVLNSYVRMHLTLGVAWEKRKKMKGPPSDVTITTTINLSR